MKKYSLIIFLLTSAFTSALAEGEIRGTVVDKTTKEPLPGVNVIVGNTGLGAATDTGGKFIITGLPSGSYSVTASFIGYKSITKPDVIVNSAKPAFINFELMETSVEIEGITVEGSYFETDPSEVISIKRFSNEEIRRAPGGFEDIVRALSVVPGVARQSAGRNDLVVRGGAPSENLYLVNGIKFPTVNHFGTQGATGGPISFINLDFVESTTFSTGGFSAKYGDKLSSVLSIDLKEGRTDRLGGKATVSASQFGLNLEGPVNDNGSFIFSLRRSYLDLIFNAAGFSFVPEYYDALGKFDFNFDNKNKISFLFTGALDRVSFNYEDGEDYYDNSRILASDQNIYAAGLTFRHLFKNGFTDLRLSRNYNSYDYRQNDSLLNPIFMNNSTEAENTLSGDIVYKPDNKTEINFGATVSLIQFDADVLFPEKFVTTFGDTLPLNSASANEEYFKSGFYLQVSRVFGDFIRVNAGVRGDYFDEIDKGFYLSPRFSFKVPVYSSLSFNFSTGMYRQFPSYIWLAAFEQNKELTAVNVNHFIGGLEYLPQEDIQLKTEVFYKDYSDYPASSIREYLVLSNTGAGFGGADNNFASFGLEPLVSGGNGYSRGIEVSAQKKSTGSGLYGLTSLTYSETYFTGLDGIERTGQYNQKWIFNLSGGYIFNEQWEVSFKFQYASGVPYTPYNNDGTQIVSAYNSARLDAIHSLDLRADRRWDFEGWNLITYIDIQNIYGRNNETSVRWNYRENKLEEDDNIGVLPSIGISIVF